MAAKNEAKIRFSAETKEFDAGLKAANKTLSSLRDELKLNEAQMKANGVSIDGLKEKQQNLASQMDAAKDKTKALADKLEVAVSVFGENSAEADRLRKQLINAQVAEAKLQGEINRCNAELEKQEQEAKSAASGHKKLSDVVEDQRSDLADLKKAYANSVAESGKLSKESRDLAKQIKNLSGELKDNEEDLSDAEKAADKLDETIEDMGDTAEKSESKLGAFVGTLAKGLAVGVAGIAAGAGAAIGAFLGLAESTMETQTQFAKLEASFNSAGHEFDYAIDTLYGLQGVLGDTDRAVEASNFLAKVSADEQDLAENTRILTGVFALYGDSIPTEGLAEGIAATAEMGVVQGVLADALEWQGINLDDFNEKLGKMKTAEERAAFVQETLTGLYGEAADAYRETNAALIEYNESQLRMNDRLATMGQVAMPVVTSLRNIASGLLMDFMPSVEKIGEGMTGVLNGTEGAASTLADGIGSALSTAVKTISSAMPTIVGVLGELIPAIGNMLMDSAPELFSSVMSLVIDLVSSIATMLPTLAQTLMSVIADLLDTLGQALPTLIPQVVGGIVDLIVVICEMFPQILQPIIDYLPDIIISIVDALMNNLPALIKGIVMLVTGIVRALPQIILGLINALPSIMTSIVNGLIEAAPVLLDGVKQIWDSLVTAIGELVVGLIDFLCRVWEDLKSRLSPIFNGIKTATVNAWNGIKTSVSNVVNGIKTSISNAFNNVKTTVSNVFDGIKSTATSVWNGIKKAITDPIESAWTVVSGVVNKLKNAFNFKWKLPDLKLPHITVTGGEAPYGIGGKGSLPKFSIEWYKDGGIMTQPTLFGFNSLTGDLMGGGEAGPEAILPIDRLQGYIEAAIDKTMQRNDLQALVNAVEDLANRAIELNINGRQFAVATAADTDSVNGNRYALTKRGLAL